ncbi:MAG: EamA family transporter [Firmicutes bacterium]|nr:EamA family transporter [Bacillota bacterium]
MKAGTVFGSICGAMTGICWGVSSVFGQFLFETRDVHPLWIVAIRLSIAGVLLWIFAFLTNRESLMALFHNKRDFVQAIICGIAGTMMFQLSSFYAVQTSNAGTATVLQYLAPVMIIVYVCLRTKAAPKKAEVLSIVLAVAGVFLISTHCDIGSLAMTPKGLFWGMMLAVFMSVNTVLPERLYKKYPTTVVIAWAFPFGGAAMMAIARPWHFNVHWDGAVWFSMFFIVIVGSVAAYLFYAQAIKRVGPTRSSLFASSEPVTATLMSALWLKTDFTYMDLIGFVLILSTLFILNAGKGSRNTPAGKD